MGETLALAISGVAAVAAVVVFVLGRRGARAAQVLADRVVTDVEPYLRRRAAEQGIDTERPVWTSRHSAAEKVKYSARLARNLNDNERGRSSTESSSTALANTMPIADSAEITAPRKVDGNAAE